MTIGIVGLSHLGLVTGICIASKGLDIIAYDPDEKLIAQLKNDQLPIYEPNLAELLASSRKTIAFSNNLSDLKKCELMYVACDVPTNEHNQSDLRKIEELYKTILEVAAQGSSIVIHSQVSPGFTRNLASELTREGRASGIKLFYQVETLIFGSAVQRALHPERYIIGCANPAEPLPLAYQTLLERYKCPLLPMRYESAELAKISINMFLVSSVSTTNTLCELCEKMGADWSEIEQALRLDKRIGQHAYLKPGLGISGGNLERDLISVKRMSEFYGTDAGIVDAWLTNSSNRSNWAFRELWSKVLNQVENPLIAIWGLAYKPGTHSVKNSPAISLLNQLNRFSVSVYDPLVSLGSSAGEKTSQKTSAIECCSKADVLIIMTPWPEFSEVDLKHVRDGMRGKVIIDPFGCRQIKECVTLGFDYISLGAK